MNQHLVGALEQEWSPPPVNAAGIYLVESEGSNISYPEKLFEEWSETPGFWSIGRTSEILRELDAVRVRSLLEVGAGTGDLSRSLVSKGIDVVAVAPLISGYLNISRTGQLFQPFILVPFILSC